MAAQLHSIRVSIHEKRNNPFSYGHYDAEVAYEVVLDMDLNDESNGGIDFITASWQEKARKAAIAECDRWEEELRQEQKFSAAKRTLEQVLLDVRLYNVTPASEDRFVEALARLPETERKEYVGRWQEAVADIDELKKENKDPIPF